MKFPSFESLVGGAVDSASAAATAAAEARWQEVKPTVYAVGAVITFFALTTWVFYFLPRFVSPFRRAS